MKRSIVARFIAVFTFSMMGALSACGGSNATTLTFHLQSALSVPAGTVVAITITDSTGATVETLQQGVTAFPCDVDVVLVWTAVSNNLVAQVQMVTGTDTVVGQTTVPFTWKQGQANVVDITILST